MKFVLFYHSLVSDWNHGNAHFLRGIISELLSRGHDVRVMEPSDGWSREQLRLQHGQAALDAYREKYPQLSSQTYALNTAEIERAVEGADVVIAHEWNAPALIATLGRLRRESMAFHLLFHDTHHRCLTAPASMQQFDLRDFDGVLAYGEVIRQIYLDNSWHDQVWTWHEAADTRVFHPSQTSFDLHGELVWIGNWGDGERTKTLQEFLFSPIEELHLKTSIFGVRYPDEALQVVAASGARYGGWLPNHRVPDVFHQHLMTIHIPRGPYVRLLPGIPTIRVFEALACGIPLLMSPWEDSERLFAGAGEPFLIAHTQAEMKANMQQLRSDADCRAELIRNGLDLIRDRHSCSHRVDELMSMLARLAEPAHRVVDNRPPLRPLRGSRTAAVNRQIKRL